MSKEQLTTDTATGLAPDSARLAISDASSRTTSRANLNIANDMDSKLSMNDVSVGTHGEERLVEERIKAGIMAVFLTSVTQDLFKIKPGDHLSAEQPFKMIPKADLLSDIQTRIAISDFHPAKQQILDYAQEEMMVHYDKEFKYGQNFFIVIALDALDAILKPIVAENDNQLTPSNALPEKRIWECLGSDKDMENEAVTHSRGLITVKVSRKLKEFGSQCKFGDRDAHDGFLECRPYRDSNYEISRAELPIAVQAVPELIDVACQTNWNRHINFCVQYEPILMNDAEREAAISSDEVQLFARTVLNRLEKALLQNEMVDIFADEYSLLGEEEMASLEQGAHTQLQEYQSFTDLKHSKDRSIACIDWHPTIRGVLAVSCVQRVTYDEKIDLGFQRSHKSLILIWSFQDPIHPQLILEAPEDVHHFEFNPNDPNIIAGGSVSGQVVIWDISEHQDKLLKMNRKSRETEGDEGSQKAVRHDRQAETSIVKWITVSSIEGSHRAPVTDLSWIPNNVEISPSGEVTSVNTESVSHQLITSALDGSVFYWDTKYKKEIKGLDLLWKPFLRVPLSAMDNTFDYGVTRFSIRACLRNQSLNGGKSAPEVGFATTKFYCATEEGDLIIADWNSEKVTEEKAQASKVEHAFSRHFGTVSDLRRSPFYPDILLSVGGWSFHVWKESHNAGPLLSSSASSAYLISGVWSPTRPGVFYISKSDGTIEVWDLMDRSHTSSSIQNVSSTALSYIQIHYVQDPKKRTSHQFIAAGDDEGTLHILEIPRNLTKPLKNEKALVKTFFEREVRRIEYVSERKQFRIAERAKWEVAQTNAQAQTGQPGQTAASSSDAEGTQSKAMKPAKKEESTANPSAVDEEAEKLEQDFLKLQQDFLEMEGLIPVDV